MSASPPEPALHELRARLAEEERAYAEVLAALDALSAFRLPAEDSPDAREKLTLLNELWQAPEKWVASSIINVARAGRFSSDRSISEYAKQIWNVAPLRVG